jgi:hypothetical protein
VAVVMVWLKSVAVKVQVPSFVNLTALNVATPLTAATEVVPAKVHPPLAVSRMVSVEPVLPVVSTLP